jgi:mannose-6-phosphate isomerase-like protein (cupin superfamily)
MSEIACYRQLRLNRVFSLAKLADLLYQGVAQIAMEGLQMRWTTLLAVVLLLVGCAMTQTEYKSDAANVIFVPTAQLHADVLKAPGPPDQRNMGVVGVVKENNYSVYVVRRTAPSLAEVHKEWTDIWYVIDGKGTIVTGGSLTEVTEPNPGEVRGRGVSGGTERQIGKGDVLRIPNGVPHWISKVDGKEIVCMVVKVPSAK